MVQGRRMGAGGLHGLFQRDGLLGNSTRKQGQELSGWAERPAHSAAWAAELGATLNHFPPEDVPPPRLLAPLADEGFAMSLLLFPEPGLDFFS